MKKTWIIARHEFSTTIRRLSYILLTASFPVLAILGILIYQGVTEWGAGAPPAEECIGYVDETGIFNDCTQDGVAFVLYDTQDEATQALLKEKVREYFVIPEDYLDTGLISRYTMQRELGPPQATIDLIENFLVSNLLSGEVSEEVMERAKTPIEPIGMWATILDEQGEVVPPQSLFASFVVPYIFALLFMLSIFWTSGFLLQAVGEEKENRLVEILLSSVSARQLLGGKIIGLGGAGLLQILIWIVSGVIIVKIFSASMSFLAVLTIPPNLIIFGIIYFILGYLLFAALMAVFGSIGATARESSQWSTIIILPAVIPLMLINLIVTEPNSILSTILTIFPLTAPITAIMRLSITQIPVWELAASIAVLIASIMAAMWLAARVFRTFMLMYGKRPSLREMWRYVREG